MIDALKLSPITLQRTQDKTFEVKLLSSDCLDDPNIDETIKSLFADDYVLFGVVDTETTGFNPDVDQIFQISISLFATDGKTISPVVEKYNCFESSVTLPDHIVSLTGVTNEYLTHLDQKIDWKHIKVLFDKCDFIVCHNAKFDYGFLSRKLKMNGLTTLCSYSMIDWKSFGFNYTNLEYLCISNGFYPRYVHTADSDVTSLAVLLMSQHGQFFHNLLENSSLNWLRISIRGQLNDDEKSAIKSIGFRWSYNESFWFKDCRENDNDIFSTVNSKIYSNVDIECTGISINDMWTI